MAEQLILKNLPFIKILPAWAQELSYKYCSKTANLYILTGNIRDFLPHKMKEGEFNFVKIQDYVVGGPVRQPRHHRLLRPLARASASARRR